MSHLYLIPLAALLGGFGRRAAGGYLNQLAGRPDSRPLTGDTPTRILYGVLIAICALMGGALWWQALLMIVAVWVGTTTGNRGAMDMGRAGGGFWRDFLAMSRHGLDSAILPTAVAAWGWHWQAAWLFGMTMLAAPCYALGWCVGGRIGNPRFPIGLRGGSELGEALWGACVGIGALLAFG